MTNDEPLTTDAIIKALSTPYAGLPRDAVRQGLERWDDIAPEICAALGTVATGQQDVPAELSQLLFFGIYMAAQMRDTRIYHPLCRLALQSERLDRVLSDGVTEDLCAIFSRVFEGDVAPLQMVAECETADEFVRDAALLAVAWLTATGRIDRAETAAWLRNLYGTLRPQEGHVVWVGWQQAIANLAMTDLTPLVEQAFHKGFIPDEFMDLHYFHDDLRRATEAATPEDAFSEEHRDSGRLDDVLALLSTWQFSTTPPADGASDPLAAENALEALLQASSSSLHDATYHNPFRNIGRNDPCPCGSGRKYKKCHLGREDELRPPLP